MSLLSVHFPASSVARDSEIATLGHVDSISDGTLAYADSVKYVREARRNSALAALITTPELASEARGIRGLVLTLDPRYAFYRLHEKWVREGLYRRPFEPHRGTKCRIHPTAVVESECWIGDNVVIGEHAVVRGCVRIGSEVTIEPGARLGVEGILYHRTSDGPRLIPHGGWVSIGDNCALMANSTVVRSVHDTDATLVGRACIIGLNSVVGHEAQIGACVVVSNNCVLARRCRVGDGAFLGTSAFIREHVSVGAGATVMAGAVVIDDVNQDAVVSGNFAFDHRSRMMEFAKKRRHSQS
jgi:UDP-3-O-[3-hydroxymyristoyl] glucosamine N-acyltransferase